MVWLQLHFWIEPHLKFKFPPQALTQANPLKSLLHMFDNVLDLVYVPLGPIILSIKA